MRFQRLDLNLLVALDALLTERSVSLAAERICLSQSATSSALGRLRDYFGDELLVVKGRQMVLTSRAESLVEPVRAVLEQIRTTISVSPPFDPATSDRTIRIMASDYVTDVSLAQVLNDLQHEAPKMRFHIIPMSEQLLETLERGFADLVITIDYAISTDHPRRILFEDDYVVVGWKDNPAMHQPMTRELYFELGHISARFGRAKLFAFEDWFVRRQKQARRVEIIAPSFLTLPSLIIGSSRIATMHRKLATRLAEHLPIVLREVPMDIPPIREAVQWHISNNNDPAIRWFVERLVAAQAKADGKNANVVPIGEGAADADEREKLAAQFQNHAATQNRPN